jgi:uncharacterized membrane protein
MLLDPAKPALSKWAVVGIGFGTLIGGWLVYDLACKSPLKQSSGLLTVLLAAFVVGVAYGLCQIMGSRAAYLHVGAMMGTCMAANVFFVIIPGQRAMVDAMERKEKPDPARGKAGGLRSLHNNYFTLPVLFIMISSHYPMTYSHEWNWALLAGISLAGAGTRHWFNLRGQGHKNAWILPVAAVLMVSAAFVTRPAPPPPIDGALSFALDIHPIVTRRCTPCHAEKPTLLGYTAPQGGIKLENGPEIKGHAQKILQHAVLTKYMPLGNLTKITEAERVKLGQWVRSGAALE